MTHEERKKIFDLLKSGEAKVEPTYMNGRLVSTSIVLNKAEVKDNG